MAEEPQPDNITEGADAPESLPANAEDRKAHKAMSSLDARGEDVEAPAVGKKEVDVKALTDAMKMLEAGSATSQSKKPQESKTEEPKKPLIKVDQADVALLVEQLDVTKVKATEMLRACGADAGEAIRTWVTAAV